MEQFQPLEQNIQLNKQTNLEIDLLLEAIYRLSGYDFRQYNRSSISRRIYNRMGINNIPTISRVQEKVIHDKEFLEQILNDFSINVTEMFRNPSFLRLFVKQSFRFYENIRKSVFGMQGVPQVKKYILWPSCFRKRGL